jgi:hypothetical protein
MFDNGVSSGMTTYNVTYSPTWRTTPNIDGLLTVPFEWTLPALNQNALNTISETREVRGSTVRFSRQVLLAFDNTC